MPHVIEPAASGRAKCRGCGERVARGELRLGERVPNPYAEGETTLWFHLTCAAFKRPEPFLEALEALEAGAETEGAEHLASEARRGLAHPRLARVDGAERAPSGRARCRSCREPIAKGGWRIRLVFYEEGHFSPSGAIHVRCAPAYLETSDVLARIAHFAPELAESELRELERELAQGA